MENKKSYFGRFFWLYMLVAVLGNFIGWLILLELPNTPYWLVFGIGLLVMLIPFIVGIYLYNKTRDSDQKNGISIQPFKNILLPWPKAAIVLAMMVVIELMIAVPLHAFQFLPCSGLDFVRKANGCQGTFSNDSFIENIAFSKDGKILATSDWNGIVKIWSYPDLTLLKKLKYSWPFPAMSLSSNGEKLAICGDNTPISILETKTGTVLHTMLQHKNDGVCDLAFNPDDKLIISVSKADGLQTWDASTGELLRYVASDQSEDLAISDDGNLLAVKTSNGIINIRRVADNSLIATFHTSHKQFLTTSSIAFSHDGKYLFAVGIDGEIFMKSQKYVSIIDVWDITSKKMDHTLTLQDTDITNLASATNSIFLVHNAFSCGIQSLMWFGNPCAYLGQTSDGKQLANLGISGQIQALTISPTDNKILIGADNGVYIWQVP